MIDGYDNRMLSAPRFVRAGNRLVPSAALVTVRCEARATEDTAAADREARQ